MARKTYDELKLIMSQYGVNRIWSWSRLNAFHNSKYEYFLKYILKIKPDKDDCIYATTGGMVHDILEKLYSGKIKYEDMVSEFDDCWTTAFDIAQLKFDRNDEEKNKKIANKYYEDLSHFVKNHQLIPHKLLLEQFVTVMVGSTLFHGYIDACYKDENGVYHIIDWKTSTAYKGAKAENECGQLVLYAMALHAQGIPYDKIRICWNFVKYVTVEYQQKNGKVKTRDIERFEIGEKLQSNIKSWLKTSDYNDDEIESYLTLLKQTNNIKCLPEEIQSKYKITDCYVYVDLTDRLINKWNQYIKETVKDIELREKDYTETKSENAFWDSEDDVKAQSYYYATLCSYSPRLLKPYQKYLDKLELAKKERDNIYANVGSNTDFQHTNNDKSKSKVSVTSNNIDNNDYSWLDKL